MSPFGKHVHLAAPPCPALGWPCPPPDPVPVQFGAKFNSWNNGLNTSARPLYGWLLLGFSYLDTAVWTFTFNIIPPPPSGSNLAEFCQAKHGGGHIRQLIRWFKFSSIRNLCPLQFRHLHNIPPVEVQWYRISDLALPFSSGFNHLLFTSLENWLVIKRRIHPPAAADVHQAVLTP
ncbi:hypothetical protein B0H14DRAFT_2573977 [Mycena olivaceomarginata]|nr:hypothetical protein B0H14DRAFT_2602542 [Mycena olivaceomarginata]KAJ7865339.1 hypothetical protein B0H14DRAFT_2573977 [Mycena olivaceomarginata]